MLKNYIKIAIAVLKRRKFFTFISLFGISITLTTLMVATALLDNIVSPGYPDTNRNRILYVTSFHMWNQKGEINGGSLSFYLINHYISTLHVPVSIGLASNPVPTNTYIQDKKLSIDIRYTDAHFWDIMQYRFLEGKPYEQRQIDNGDRIAIISEDTKNDYFGKDAMAVGKYMETDNVLYRIVGVVANDPATHIYTSADMYLPYSLSKVNLMDKQLNGSLFAFLLAGSGDDVPRMRQEFNDMFAKIPILNKDYDHQLAEATGYLETFTSELAGGFGRSGPFRGSSHHSSGIFYFYMGLGILCFMFMLLPTLNLVNINITRIMERSSEIGVRKAFGASSSTLVYQFIIENTFLTVIGGAIGVLLSVIILQIINHSRLIPHIHLVMNGTVLFFALLFSIVFGLVSGVYPAWRMSRLNVVAALKA
jgi:putative ABC transport system permease protein